MNVSVNLPIESLRERVLQCLDSGPLVLSAPTGSGKSTRVPVWCLDRGPVLVVEPRRIACRSLAKRIADTEGYALGGLVGYRVRDDDKTSASTKILFATPGVVLRMLRDDPSLRAFDTVVIDEFHERSLDTDLICALIKSRRQSSYILMSATIDGDRLAEYIGGPHVHAPGRTYDVEIEYLAQDRRTPSADNLDARVIAAIDTLSGEGHILVFLPGKREIESAYSALSRHPSGSGMDIVRLHGGLSLQEQSKVFASSPRQKIVLTTNVAETSLTVPGVRSVVDSGLVRQTRYRAGRGFLTLCAVSMDSANQRAGRAGRTAPGRCIRLWANSAPMDARTLPELHRESLTPLVFAAAAVGARADTLVFPDEPKKYALESAQEELMRLGALGSNKEITSIGKQIFDLPLDVGLGRMLVEARLRDCLGSMIPVVAALSIDRPLFRTRVQFDDPDNDLREAGCDAHAIYAALTSGQARRHCLNPEALSDARRVAQRLRQAFGVRVDQKMAFDRKALAMAVMAADRSSVFVPRDRKKYVAWSNGGTEVSLGQETGLSRAYDRGEYKVPRAILGLETRALGKSLLKGEVIITAAMAVPLDWVHHAGIGRVMVEGVSVSSGLMARMVRRHAGAQIKAWEECPRGAAAVDAVVCALMTSRLWPGLTEEVSSRLERWSVFSQVFPNRELDIQNYNVEDWIRHKTIELGVESGDDVALLDKNDFLPPPVPADVASTLERKFPARLEFSDVKYDVRYAVPKKTVYLHVAGGQRRNPPPLSWLPSFSGFRIVLVDRRGETVLRRR